MICTNDYVHFVHVQIRDSDHRVAPTIPRRHSALNECWKPKTIITSFLFMTSLSIGIWSRTMLHAVCDSYRLSVLKVSELDVCVAVKWVELKAQKKQGFVSTESNGLLASKNWNGLHCNGGRNCSQCGSDCAVCLPVLGGIPLPHDVWSLKP